MTADSERARAGTTPILARRVSDVFEQCERTRRGGERVAFVPTMGALHDGHLALVREAARRARFVVVSIFVNPAQFGPGEDFARYPRQLERDVAILSGSGAELGLVFAPDVLEMYPPGDETRVRVGALAEPLCGPFRPGHFEGVATVVTKLLGAVGACDAIFGRKDYQQLLVVRRLARDLLLPVEIVDCPIVREPDGLAMSSRNAFLGQRDRVRARSLSLGLDAAARAYVLGERGARQLEIIARAHVAESADSIDYVELRDAATLAAVQGEFERPALLAIACRIGGTRLLDNVVLGVDAPPLEALPLPRAAR